MRCCVRCPLAPTWGLSENGARRTAPAPPARRRSPTSRVGSGEVEEPGFARAVGRALDLGVNCFDTAEGYGMGASERALGEALGRRRDEAIVVSKFGMNYRDKPNLRDSSRERVVASIDKSLKNLGTDYVDAYLVHWPDRTVPFEETMGALDDLVKDGKIRFVGL